MSKKISELPLTTTPATSVEFEINDGGVSKRVSLTNVLSATTLAYQSADTALQSQVSALQTDRAQLVSPAFTGTPTAPTASAGTNTTQLATTAFATTADLLRLRLSGADLMTGTLQMNTNKITGLTAGTTGTTDAANVTQIETLLLNKSSFLDAYDPTVTSAFPTSHSINAGSIKKGNRFRITVAGTMAAGTSVVQIGDVIEANGDAAGNVAAEWTVIQSNAVQATTTVSGIGETATDAEAVSKASTTVFLTPSNLATGNFRASATFEGLIELATQSEVDAGTDTTRAITPATMFGRSLTYTKFVGLDNVLNYSAGTWTTTRVAQGDYVKRKTAAADTTIIGIAINTDNILGGTSGFKLSSFDVIHRNTTADLTAHTYTLTRNTYADSTAISQASIALTGTLPLTQDADPRVTNVTVNTPAFINADNYILELTVNAAATSAYDFIGIVLHFTQTT